LTGYSLGQSTTFNSTTLDSTDWHYWGEGSPGNDTENAATYPYGWFNSNELNPTTGALYLSNAWSTNPQHSGDMITDGIGAKTYTQVYGAYDWCEKAANDDNHLDTVALLWPITQAIASISASAGTASVTMVDADGYTNNSQVVVSGTQNFNGTQTIATTGSTTFTFPSSAQASCSGGTQQNFICGKVDVWPPEIDFAEFGGGSNKYGMTIHFYDSSGNPQMVQATPGYTSWPNASLWNEFLGEWASTYVVLYENGSAVAEIADGTPQR
jgi:hypothetical protein